MSGSCISLRCALVVLVVCASALASQGPKRSAPAPKPPLSAQEIFKRVSPSVMLVESLDAEGKVAGFGSGVVIAPSRVITNRHVIEDGVSFKVEHGANKWPAKLVRLDPDHDLAELSVVGLAAPSVQVRESFTLAVGERVYAIGAPEGLEVTISEGLISGLRDFDKARVIQTSAAISPGSSGGGLFDAEGWLVGITTFYLKEGQSLNFALPAEWTLALNRQPAIASPDKSEDSPEFQAFVWLEAGWHAQEQPGKGADAVHDFLEATRLKPDLEIAWVLLGAAYEALGKYEKAISAYQEAIRLKPDDHGAWISLGDANGALGEFDKEVSAQQQAIRLEPDNGEAWGSLAYAYGRLGQHDKAVSAGEEAIRLKPDGEAAWYNLGAAYYGLGQDDKAVSAFQEAIRLKPDDARDWLALGLAFKRSGQQPQVIRVYKKLKTLDPKLADKFFKEAVLP